jgi:putative ABC transport system permease protein
MYGIATMDEVISDSLAQRRFLVAMLGGFAGLALLLATIGIYGVISYLVAQRSHEIGLRMALGAQRRDVLRLVLGHGGKLALAGIICGLLASFGLTHLMKTFLYGVRATDPLTFTGVAILLMFVALMACYLPARRAMRVDPMVALRHE